jgi:prepilin-type processing-associated H-X9-DG protein
LGFQSFAHDHNGRFPTQVSVRDGGIEECRWKDPWTTNVFRVLQSLSNDLVNPKIFICPSFNDRNRWQTNWARMIEVIEVGAVCVCRHCTYIGNLKLTAEDVGKPTTILAADGHLRPGEWPHYDRGVPTLDKTNYFHWGDWAHRLKGNLLFADGHVEWLPNGPALNSAMAQSASAPPSRLPTRGKVSAPPRAPQVNVPSPKSPSAPPPYPPDQSASTTSNPRPSPSRFPQGASTAEVQPFGQGSSQSSTQYSGLQISNRPVIIVTNEPVVLPAEVVADDSAAMGATDVVVVRVIRSTFQWLYLLLFLAVLSYLAYKYYRWQKRARQRSRVVS